MIQYHFQDKRNIKIYAILESLLPTFSPTTGDNPFLKSVRPKPSIQEISGLFKQLAKSSAHPVESRGREDNRAIRFRQSALFFCVDRVHRLSFSWNDRRVWFRPLARNLS